jgi:hypothetical protein
VPDPFIREKFTKERSAARKLAAEYFQRFPKDRYQTEVESWRNLQSANIEFTMKRRATRSRPAPSHEIPTFGEPAVRADRHHASAEWFTSR